MPHPPPLPTDTLTIIVAEKHALSLSLMEEKVKLRRQAQSPRRGGVPLAVTLPSGYLNSKSKTEQKKEGCLGKGH